LLIPVPVKTTQVLLRASLIGSLISAAIPFTAVCTSAAVKSDVIALAYSPKPLIVTSYELNAKSNFSIFIPYI
jgi:hypothetical protein